ncbi:RraA family protein [Nocardia sp. R16R-3T]
MSSTSTVLARLEGVDACAVSDALDLLGASGVALGLQRLTTLDAVRGRVITVKLVPAQFGQKSARHLGASAIEAARPGDVIVIDHGGRADVSGWGGNLSLAAVAAGVRGVIIDGACRDVDESREVGLPIFGLNGVPLTARGRVVEQAWNVPVTIRGVRVDPGDFVVADGSGVVFIAAADADRVLGAAEQIVGKEKQMAERIRNGDPISEVMGAQYETMLEARA